VQLPFSDMTGQSVSFRDLMSPAFYERDGNDLMSRGLYLDLPEWDFHVFEVSASSK
jgi:hypothetical protein